MLSKLELVVEVCLSSRCFLNRTGRVWIARYLARIIAGIIESFVASCNAWLLLVRGQRLRSIVRIIYDSMSECGRKIELHSSHLRSCYAGYECFEQSYAYIQILHISLKQPYTLLVALSSPPAPSSSSKLGSKSSKANPSFVAATASSSSRSLPVY